MELSDKKFQELKEKKISIEDLNEKYFYTKKDGVNVENILKLLNESICSFEKIVDKSKSIKDKYDRSCLKYLLSNKKSFEELIENNRLSIEDLKYLLNRISEWYEVDKLSRNTSLLKYIVDVLSFKELVNKFKSIKNYENAPCLCRLLYNRELSTELIKINRLNKEDLRYLLNRIDNVNELEYLCRNTPLTKYILNEFILNKEDVNRFNTMIENSWYKKECNTHTILELIEYWNKNNEEILNLNELNEKVYLLNSLDLNEDQKLKLIEVLRDNEVAQNRLIQIIDSNLESNYDFDSLMRYLKKVEKKNILNI